MVESSRVRRRREQRVCAKLNARYQYSRETTRRDASLLFLSLNSLSRDWWQNRALKMWWCFLLKKKRQTKFFQRQKKMSRVLFFCIFCCSPHNHIILYVLATHREQYEWNRRTKQKNENESKNDEKEYLFCTRACVCAETVLCYSFHKRGIFLRGFSRFARMS